MHISLISGGLGPGAGTAGQAWLLAHGLIARGHDVEVWTSRTPTATPDRRLAVRPLPRSRRALWSAAGRPRDGRLVVALDRAPGAPVVRASGGVHEAWLRASRSTLCSTMPAVLPRDRTEISLDRHTARRARRVICNSIKVAAELSGFHGVDPGRVRVVRNAVDLERFADDPAQRRAARTAWQVGGRVALFLGSGWHRKNLWAAARAFDAAADPADRLIVAGRGSALRRARVQHLLGRRVRFVGRLAHPERWLCGADVVLHPTRYDASANVVLEAMAAGVPAVTTARDGAAEIVPVRSLVVADPDDVAGLSAAVAYAWSAGPELRSRVREAASDWPVSRMVQGVEQTIEECVHG